MGAESRHAPFETAVSVLSIIILNEGFILLVDRVVGQMGVLGFLASQVRVLILFRCKADQTLPVDVDSKRVVARHNDVEAEVKLVALDEQWVVQIATNYALLPLYHVFETIHDVDAASTRGRCRLANPVVVAERANPA